MKFEALYSRRQARELTQEQAAEIERRRSVLIRKLWHNHLFSMKVASTFRIKTTCAHDIGKGKARAP
jgi:hypothetical protein